LGLFDKLREVSDFVKYARDDWNENVAPAFREVGETATDGFKEMVIKRNSDYKTSYEKMDIANTMIDEAKVKYEEAVKGLERFYQKTNKLVMEHYQFKQSLHEDLLQEKQHLINEFARMRMEKRRVDHPSGSFMTLAGGNLLTRIAATGLTSSFVGAGFVTSGLSAFGKLNPALVGISVAGWFIEKNKRVAAANEHLKNAEAFKREVKVKIEEIYSVKSRLVLIQKKIKEERSLIERLLVKLEKSTQDFSDLKDRVKLSETENQRAEAMVLIANAINDTLTTQFLIKTGRVSTRYNDMLNNLKQVESLLKERGI
jgi:hypothetical protein